MAKYLKRDSEKGFIEDYVEIQSLKFDNVRHTVLGNMLGNYDDQGYYRVNPDIVAELIAMPKYIVEVMDNLEICLSTIKLDKQISFLVAYEGEKVTLSLIEKVSFEANNKLDSGTWSNVNEYVLDVVETSGEIDRQALYIKWNIQTFPGEIIDIFNCEDSVLAKYFNIVNRFKYNIEAKTILLDKEEQLEDIEAEYFLDLFEILNSYPELKKAVEKQLKQTLNEKKDFVKIDKPNFTKTINEVLSKAIEDNIGVLSDFEKTNFEIEKRNVTVKANIKKYDTLQIQEEKLEKVEEEKDLEAYQEVDTTVQPLPIEKVVVSKIVTDNVKFKTLDEVAKTLAEKEKQVGNRKKDEAKAIFIGESFSNVAQVVDAVVKTGVATATIISAPLIAALAGKEVTGKAVEKTVEKAQDSVKKAVAPIKKATSADVKKKPVAKKETKTKVKGENQEPVGETQEEQKSETKSVSGGYYSVGSAAPATSQADTFIDASNKKLKGELGKSAGNKKGIIGQRVEADKKRNSLIVDAVLLEHEDQKEKATTNSNSNTAAQNLEPKATTVPGDLEPKTTSVTIIRRSRVSVKTGGVSVRTAIKPKDNGLGL